MLSFSIKTSVGLRMNFLQVILISPDSVAVNIMTCLLWGVSLKIFWISLRMPLGDVKKCGNEILTDLVEKFVTFVQNKHL